MLLPVTVDIVRSISKPPLFVQPLAMELIYDQATMEKANYTLPKSLDPNGDDYSIVIWLEESEYMSYDELT